MSNPSSSAQPLEAIQTANWAGSIPVILTLAPTSLSSPTLPAPIHLLLPRQTFLHVGLSSAVERLHKFAPTTLSFVSGMIRKEPGPGSYDESSATDEEQNREGNQPLGTSSAPSPTKSSDSHRRSDNLTKLDDWDRHYPVCWFEDEETQIALRWHIFVGVLYDIIKRDSKLPWKIRLHFTGYPVSQILPMESGLVLTQVKNAFKNSLKQALCLQHGNSKAAMSITKESHGRLWDAVSTNNFQLYHQVHANTMPKQLPKDMVMIPVRIYVNAQPPIQRACRADESATLGSLLADWLPHLFLAKNEAPVLLSSVPAESLQPTVPFVVQPAEAVVVWRVCGLSSLPLGTAMLELWSQLCHADHFVYIVVITN